MTSWSATMPGSRTEWIGTSPPISSAVRLAVPDGASSFAGWWSSMISARCMWRGPPRAKRSLNTPPRPQVVERHRVEALHELVGLEQRHAEEQRAAEPVHARARGLLREHHPRLDVLARPD